MESQQEKWNKFYSQQSSETTDPWLLRYTDFFEGCGKVLDLGCGNGSNIPFLLDMKADIVALDYSETAIEQIKKKWPITTIVHDVRKALPFPSDTFNMILADLSLHYFTFLETAQIIEEIYRITKNKGMLVARVNSINDINHGYGIGIEVEENYFDLNGRRKRFFDKEMIYDLFDENFVVTKAIENRTNKYEDEKVLWEILTVKIA